MKPAFVSLLLLCSAVAFSQSSTSEIMNEARAVAAKEGKNVFILFHASWCGWCRKMDSSMNDASVRKFFNDNYVIRHLVVYESKGKEKLENPGALELLTKYKGNDLGIPYWLIFDPQGNMLADSKRRPEGGGLETGENTGCPATEPEVDHLVNMIQRTSRLKAADLALIKKRFRMNE